MTDYIALHQKTNRLYRSALKPLADSLAFELPVHPEDAPRQPAALFLGNHSSGKSSFINHLLGIPIQKTGLAPTDDGFTIIAYGETADSFDGQTVASHPALAWQNLHRLGPAFISKLRLRSVPCSILQEFNLIDSPGMIDAAGPSNTRQYDFEKSVRTFAEYSDLILFFFDPDKPGTTAETISILTHTLAGLEHKLMIILNKADLFATMRDFARSYGALCWNLSKAIPSKDIPHIFTTYLPEQANTHNRPQNSGLPLEDFDAARKEIINKIKQTPTRRADNSVSDLLQTAQKLAIHSRVCDQIGLAYRNKKLLWRSLIVISPTATAILAWLLWNQLDWKNRALLMVSGLTISILTYYLGKLLLDRFRHSLRRVEFLDAFFNQAYNHEIGLSERQDLQALWTSLCKEMPHSLQAIPPSQYPFRLTRRRLIQELEKNIKNDIPQLRRQLETPSSTPSPPPSTSTKSTKPTSPKTLLHTTP